MTALDKTAAIIVNQASLTYSGELLFDKLNLILPAKKWSVLLGPSGVGKTSLLQFIAGLTSDVHTQTPVTDAHGQSLAGHIAYMPQNDCLLPWLSVLNNVLISARLSPSLATASLRKHAGELLKKLGLAKDLHKKPEQLSGGMRQRVALARTFLTDKPIVLMDEPFSALDAITRLQLQDLAAELMQERTVLLVTHDPREALRLGDYIYVMEGRPAHLGAALPVTRAKPRSLSDPILLELEAELLTRLVKAKESL